MKKSSPPTAIIEIEGKKSRKSGPKGQGFFTLSQINEDFTTLPLISKTLELTKNRSTSLRHLQ
jgi:hypothetical protein